ncbi:MAG: TlpA disulfide reductase family protein [Chthonomonadales bacterium]
MRKTCMNSTLSIGLLATTLLIGQSAISAAQKPIVIKLDQVDPTGANKLGYYPIRVELSPKKPAGISKEPTYRSTPKYATIHLGNGPKSAFNIAVDEPAGADWKIYVDANQNGDLTDDGDGAWKTKREGARPMYGVNPYTLKASWGSEKKETATAPYSVNFYRFTNMDYLLMYRSSARTGTVTVDGKTHKATLIENDADALFSKPLDDAGKPLPGAKATNAVWLLVDWNDDGKMGSPIDIRSPFKLKEVAMEAMVKPDGSEVKLIATKRVVAEKPKPAEAKALLAAGTMAPDFKCEAYGGGELKLSDFRGKVVILDFWATWCGPCQKSMPHIEKVYQSVKDQNVVVLGVCVWDEKKPYEEWVPANKSKYTFKFAFDPAGRAANNIAGGMYNVSGIPTTYIIDKDGKIVEAVVGYQDGDTRVESALKKVGVTAANLK